MDASETAGGLAWWAGPGQDPGAAFGRVRGHPAQAQAVRALAAKMLDLFAADPRLAEVLKDAGRYVAVMLAFLLHETGELTLPRLKEACASSGLLSPGRARALLQYLEHVGYIARAGRSGPCLRFVPTPAFHAAWTRQLLAALEAALPLEPQVAQILRRPDAVAAFGRAHAGALLELTRGWAEPPAFLRVFQHSYAGTQILWWLLVTGDDPDDFAPARIGPISLSALSRRFDVSRIHVKRIFQDAERHGLGGLQSDGVVWFTGTARDQIRRLFTAQLAQILAAAGRAMRESGAPGGQKCAVV